MNKEKINIKNLAMIFVKLEKEIEQGINKNENMKQMEKLTSKLTMEQMLELDEYILAHNLITKGSDS